LEEELLCCLLLYYITCSLFLCGTKAKELENQFDCLCMSSGTGHPILVLSGLSELGS
jgi:hypothetical protein